MDTASPSSPSPAADAGVILESFLGNVPLALTLVFLVVLAVPAALTVRRRRGDN